MPPMRTHFPSAFFLCLVLHASAWGLDAIAYFYLCLLLRVHLSNPSRRWPGLLIPVYGVSLCIYYALHLSLSTIGCWRRRRWVKEIGSTSCCVCWQLRKTQATGPNPKVGEWGEASGRVSPVGSLLTQKQNPPPPGLRGSIWGNPNPFPLPWQGSCRWSGRR